MVSKHVGANLSSTQGLKVRGHWHKLAQWPNEQSNNTTHITVTFKMIL